MGIISSRGSIIEQCLANNERNSIKEPSQVLVEDIAEPSGPDQSEGFEISGNVNKNVEEGLDLSHGRIVDRRLCRSDHEAIKMPLCYTLRFI